MVLDTKPFRQSTPTCAQCLLISSRASSEQPYLPMDIVYLHGLRLETVIGIWDWEREIRQTVVVDLDMGTDISRAGRSDAIEDTVDYKAVAKRLMNLADESEFFLVEALAERIAEIVIGEFGIPWTRIRVNKQGALRGARDVGVVIERGHGD